MNKKVIILSLVGVLVLAGTVGGTLLLAKNFLMPHAVSAAVTSPAAEPKPVVKDAQYKTKSEEPQVGKQGESRGTA